MKKIEWLITISLIIIGLACLTVSGTTMLGTESVRSYLKMFILLCLWTGLPVLIIGIVYIIILNKRKSKYDEMIAKGGNTNDVYDGWRHGA